MDDGTDPRLADLPGIGPRRAAALAARGLERRSDLLLLAPHCLGEAPAETAAGPLPRGRPVQVRGCLAAVTRRPAGRGRRGLVVETRFTRADGRPFAARFFNAGWLAKRLEVGTWYLLDGRSDLRRDDILLQPRLTRLAAGAADATPARSGVAVAHPVPPGLGDATLHRLLDDALEHDLPRASDPAGLVDDATWRSAIRSLHRPASVADHEAAHRLLAARELLALAWTLHARRAARAEAPGRAWPWDDDRHRSILARLPHPLTPAQALALADLRADLRRPAPMLRLLSGDVGSGKTALALACTLAVAEAGAQVLVLAPTAILARQLQAVFRPRTTCGLLTTATPAAERGRLLTGFADQSLPVLIGTHALLDEAVRARDLGLVIIDEQHRFGVAQRAAALRADAGGPRPDLLLLTATPIPRTLALTLYGDLDLTRIAGRPPGRSPVATTIAPLDDGALLAAVRSALDDGGRAFVIAPLRQATGRRASPDAESVARRLAAALGAATVALIHGGLDDATAEAALDRFRDGHAGVLVATTVVEVGIDVPAATLMVVLEAERFGLAQLHQLRGRVGRGLRSGRCLLLWRDPAAAERLAVLADHDDGLAVAEADLARRGPGDLLGERQHGLEALRCTDLARDGDLLVAAAEMAGAAITAGRRPPPELLRLLPPAAAGAG